jgi:hypothetical protein
VTTHEQDMLAFQTLHQMCLFGLTLWIHVKCLLASYRVSSDNGVLRRNRIPAGNTATVQTSINLLEAGVYGLQSVESFPEARRQPLIGLDHVGEQSVTTCGRTIEHIQESRAGGLLLKGDI